MALQAAEVDQEARDAGQGPASRSSIFTGAALWPDAGVRSSARAHHWPTAASAVPHAPGQPSRQANTYKADGSRSRISPLLPRRMTG